MNQAARLGSMRSRGETEGIFALISINAPFLPGDCVGPVDGRDTAERNILQRMVLEQVMTKLPHDALVFIGDGRKALFLRNAGDEQILDLRTERVFAEENPPTHEQGTDRPGRGAESAGTHRRTSMDQTDWHHLEEHRFTARVAKALEDVVRKNHVPAILIAAPPKTLADLRKAFHADVKAKIVAEIGKDLTQYPVDEIGRHLRG
jgi:protein required for attachment to host cells